MTIVPNRLQDGDRRPRASINGSAGVTNAGSNNVGSSRRGRGTADLPPILFQLPNLNPATAPQSTADQPCAGDDPNNHPADHSQTDLNQTASPHQPQSNVANNHRTLASGQMANANDSVIEPERSFLSRLSSIAMIAGVIGLGGMWIYVVAKNVRTGSSSTTTAQADDSLSTIDEALDASKQSQPKTSTASLEDTMAGAERLALNPSGNLPVYSPPQGNTSLANTTPSQASTAQAATPADTPNTLSLDSALPQQMRAEVDAAALEIRAALDKASAVTSGNASSVAPSASIKQPSMATDQLSPDFGPDMTQSTNTWSPTQNEPNANAVAYVAGSDQLNVSTQNAAVSDQIAANPVTARTATSANGLGSNDSGSNNNAQNNAVASTGPGLQSPTANVADAAEPPLPATGSDSPAKPSPKANAPQPKTPSFRYSKTPTPVSDWLKYLPPKERN